MSAGNMVYGLYRVPLLARAGVYRRVLVPDRLLMTELAVYGQFKQVPQVLWFRRWYGRIFSLDRQRKSFFPEGRPLYMWAPWWMSHGVSLFWTFGVQRNGLPAVTRTAGMILGAKYLVSSGLFHVWQQLRALRIDLLERLGRLRPYERKLRLAARELHRQGVVDWTGNRLKPYVGAKARRKAVSRMKKGARQASSQAVRGPGLALLRMVRSIPLVRKRVIPSLLKAQLDQVPAAPIVTAMTRDLERLRKSSGPILIGPWISEVGFEVLYWIPFLNWAIKAFGLDERRLIVVSRGGARLWYQHLTTEYIDIFDLFSVEEYRARNEERWSRGGNQKQFDVTAMEREIVDRAKQKLGLADVEWLHPSVMYKLLRFFWFEKASVRLLTEHADYKTTRRQRPDAEVMEGLPREYVAVAVLLPAVVPGHAGKSSLCRGRHPLDQPRRPRRAVEHRLEPRRSRGRRRRQQQGRVSRRSPDDARSGISRSRRASSARRARSSGRTAASRIWVRSTACRRWASTRRSRS